MKRMKQVGAGVKEPDSLRKGKIEISGFMDVMAHPHYQLDLT